MKEVYPVKVKAYIKVVDVGTNQSRTKIGSWKSKVKIAVKDAEGVGKIPKVTSPTNPLVNDGVSIRKTLTRIRSENEYNAQKLGAQYALIKKLNTVCKSASKRK